MAANGLKHVASVASTMTTSSTKPLLPSAGNDTPSDQSVDLEVRVCVVLRSAKQLYKDGGLEFRLISLYMVQ